MNAWCAENSKNTPSSKLLEFLNLDPRTLLPLDTSGPATDNSEEESDADHESTDDNIEDEGDADSDAEDVFLTIQPSGIADQTTQGQRYLAMRYLEEHLKEDVTMPFQSDWCSMDCDADLESGISLPPWHCPFLDCRCCWQSDDVEKNHEEAWWQHVWHTVSHKVVCLKSLQMANLAVADADLPETVFALLVAAMTEKERRNPCMVPRVGLAVDRRTLVHLGETFEENNIKCLMCFVCGCKYLYHQGFNKFGEPVNKGDINYHSDTDRVLSRLLHGDKKDSLNQAFSFNMSRKRFKDHFGEAVRTDDSFANDTWEWKRITHRNGEDEEVMCNPEDVLRSTLCLHDDHIVCSKCRIPFCNDCRRLTQQNQKIPKALTNDNFIGYMNRYIVKHRVTWLEATIASPVFTGLITYYIEGAQEHRHHLMEETIAQPQRAYGVRGSLFSFLMPWEKIQEDVEQKLRLGNLSEWPLSPDHVGHILRVRFMRGPVEILNKFKELSVRAKVIKDVAHMYVTNHCQDLVDRPGVLAIHSEQHS